jgi:hypothetical protein
MVTPLTPEIDMKYSWPVWIILVIIAIGIIVFGPFLIIWALNTLFPVLAIPYTLETWAATILLKGFVSATVKKKD